MSKMRVTGKYDYNVICDVCGFKKKASEVRQRWDGYQVCKEDWEQRHPLDFYRTRNDTHKLPFTRPDEQPTDLVSSGYALSFLPYQNAVVSNMAYAVTAYPITVEAMVYFKTYSTTNLQTVCRHGSGHCILRREFRGGVLGGAGFYFQNSASTFRSFTSPAHWIDNNLPLFTWGRLGVVVTSDSAATFYIIYQDSTGTVHTVSTTTITYGSVGAYAAGPSDWMMGATTGFSEQGIDLLDDIRIWNIAVSGANMTANWNVLLPNTTTGLVSNYRFDEGYVNGVPSATTTDAVNTANVATIYGAQFFPHEMVN
ncbi:MAG: hypothetical protein ACYC9R_12715 [Nitrosotalea sp.]